jgi:hypothetical protein
MLRLSLVFPALLLAVGAGSAFAAKDDSNNSARADDSSGIRVTEVRDWSQIDKDHDGYVEPDEMQAYLQQYQARTGKNTATASETNRQGADTKRK